MVKMPNTTLLQAAGYGSFLVAVKHAVSEREREWAGYFTNQILLTFSGSLLGSNSSVLPNSRNCQILHTHAAQLVGIKEAPT